MIKKLLSKVMLLLMILVVGAGSAWADPVTVSTTSFSATSGNVGNDSKVTYTAYKGGGTSEPGIYSNALRLYQNSSATGGYVVIGVEEGYTIISATIRSTQATITGYLLSESAPTSTPAKNTFDKNDKSLSANTDYTVDDISTRYITFACFGTNSSSRLNLSKISITYQASGVTPSTYTVTYDGNDATSGDVPEDNNEYEEDDEVTVLGNTGSLAKTGYTFGGWNTQDDGQGTNYTAGNTFTISANTTLYAKWIQNPYTVTLGDDSSTLTEASGGAGVTLPSRSDIGGYTFAGWSTTNVTTETTTAPAAIIPEDTYNPTSNITLYPVYTKTEGGSAPSAFSVGDTGDFAIVAELSGIYYALPTNPTVNNGKITAQEIAVSELNNVKFVTPANASGFTWTIATATNGYTLSDGNHYIYHSNGGASGTNLTYGDATTYTWAFTADGDYIKLAGMSGSTTNNRGLLFSSTTIGGYSLNNWETYAKTMILPIANAGTTYYWSSPVAATVERPEITVAANPFVISTTATITCETEGATIKYSYDGENWNDYSSALTITETKTIYAKAVKNEDESTVASVEITKNLATPTVTISATGITNTNVYTGTAAGSLAATVTYNEVAVEGAVVTWNGNNNEVATINTSTGAVTLVGAGSVTFTASYAGNSDYAGKTATYEMTVTNVDPNAPGMENNPYTVAQANANTPSSGNVYIHGIVSAFYNTDIMSDGNNYRYYISDDGTTTSQLLVYKGKNLSNVAFSNADDLLVGDEVVICGSLITYSNAPEIASGNYIVSLVRKTVPGLAWSTNAFNAVNGEANVYPTLTNTNSVAVTYSSSDENVATIANDGTITLVANGETTITAAFAGNSEYLEQEVSYTLTVSGFSKDAAGIAFADNEVNITWGDTFEGQALTNPNGLTVAYTSTNEAVAQVNANTGAVTIVKAGLATITATFTENEDYLGAVVSYTVNVAKAAAGLSFSETSFKVVPGAAFVAPTLNNPNSLTVTYSSNDEDVALVDENTGEVVIGDEGIATITAASAETDNYLAGNVTYTITVTTELEMTWDLSTNSYSSSSEDQVKWTNTYATMVADKANSTTVANNYLGGDSNSRTSTRFYKNSTLTITPAIGYQITSVEFTATSNNYASALSGSTWTNATAIASETTVTVTPTNGLTAMTATIGNTCGFTSVKVNYKELASADITLAAACTDGEYYYATFSCDRAFVVSDEIIVSEVSINGTKIETTNYATGAVVPANTGVLISSLASGDFTVNFSAASGTSVLGTSNCLRPTGNTGITAQAMAAADANSLYYRLTINGENNPGFYWAEDDGASFAVAANKAYLVVPDGTNVKGFTLGFETAIQTIASDAAKTQPTFNLMGQRVNASTRGIVIRNGKKYINK